MTTRDDDVLKELQAELDVRPRPGFESRVMRRVLQGADSPKRLWIVPALGTASALVMVYLLLPSRTAPAPDRPILADAVASTSARSAPVANSLEPGRPRLPQRERIALAAARRRPNVGEVLVPDDQARRLQTFLDAVTAGQVVMAPPRPEPAPEIESLPLAPTSPVVIQAMAIKPLSEDVSQTKWR